MHIEQLRAVKIAMEKDREARVPKLESKVFLHCPKCRHKFEVPPELDAFKRAMSEEQLSTDNLPAYKRGRARIEYGEHLFNQERGLKR